ncbi:hypothetical protein [Archangium violaceum]|uniref:hypothetical protein n=1 Tax=Archangium violaceum TaxID=83451 RepID=UPI001F3C4BF3|nr:hypothetical protein [Archangium violaceum]
MKTILAPRRLGAAVLCLLFAACTATRYPAPGPMSARELARSVLVIEESPDGQVSHTWKPLEDFDLTKYPYHASHGGLDGRLVRVATSSAHCDSKQQMCISLCTSSPRPIPIEGRKYPSYLGSWAKNRGRWCERTCTDFHQRCINGQGPWAEQEVQEFTGVEIAVDWLKKHRKEIVTGTLIVIAGVAFVAAMAGSGGGALYLVPLLAVASIEPLSGFPAAPRVSEVLNANP